MIISEIQSPQSPYKFTLQYQDTNRIPPHFIDHPQVAEN